MGVIYALWDPRNEKKGYIGWTTNLHRRIQYHLADRRYQTYKRHWLDEMERAGCGPIVEVLEWVGDDWAAREQYWIAHYKCAGYTLTNSTAGGEGSVGYVPSPEMRTKLSRHLRGRVSPNKGNHYRMSESARKSISQNRVGKYHSAESIEKMRQAHARRPREQVRVNAIKASQAAFRKMTTMSEEELQRIHKGKREGGMISNYTRFTRKQLARMVGEM